MIMIHDNGYDPLGRVSKKLPSAVPDQPRANLRRGPPTQAATEISATPQSFGDVYTLIGFKWIILPN